jgi:hypothetical protein
MVRRGPSRCFGAEEAWASFGCSILTLCMSDGIRLVVKEVGSRV